MLNQILGHFPPRVHALTLVGDPDNLLADEELRAALAGSGLFAGLPYRAWQARLDGAFMAWLQRRYAPLGGQRIPTPHHLHHVPHLMAYERRQKQAGKVALLVLDGMALADWLLVREAWQSHQTEWQVEERLLLAQIPPITAVSRQALVSGRRPADFGDSLSHNRQEGNLWAAFWAREDVPVRSVAFDRLRLDDLAPVINNRVQALCLVYSGIDDLIHGATLGAAGVQASLRLWLANQSPRLEAVIADLLDRGFTVYVASDHGHTEARGMGQPREGVTVETRSKRARIYRTENAALAVQADFPESILWHGDGLLPDDLWVLLPLDENGRRAFAAEGEQVVTHGGLTLDEVVTPLVRVSV